MSTPSHHRVTENQLQQLKSLVAALHDEDYSKAKQLLLLLVQANQKDRGGALVQQPHALAAILHDCLYKTLLELDDKVLLQKELSTTASSDGSGSSFLAKQRAYILYRLEQYDQVLAVANDDDDDDDAQGQNHATSDHQYLTAQSLYRLGRSSAAFRLYQELLADATASAARVDENEHKQSDDNDILAQLYANLLATRISTATPYCKAEHGVDSEILELLLERELDVALNHGIWRAMESNDLQPLRKVLRAGSGGTTTAAASNDDNTVERARFALQTARDYWKGSSNNNNNKTSGLFSSPVLESIRRHNHVLSQIESPQQALEQLQAAHDGNIQWSPLQQRVADYNKACLQLRAKHYDDCRVTVKEATSLLLDKTATLSKQKQQSQQAQDLTSAQALWWQARMNVLLYYCDEAQRTSAASAFEAVPSSSSNAEDSAAAPSKHVQLLQSTLEKLRALEPSAVGDEAILYLLLHMGEPLSASNVPTSLQSRVGMQYALGTADKTGDWYMANGDSAAAVECYQKEQDDTPSSDATRAKLVRALSYVDPDRAMQLWAGLKTEIVVDDDEAIDQVNGAELEQQELPRLKSSKSRKPVATVTLENTSDAEGAPRDNKKSHDAILRRRARDKQAHLDKLTAQGLYRPERPVAPDPERWLPKYERSHNRKRRNNSNKNQQHRGAQGGVSEKETQKLDVVARQHARANGEAGGNTAKSTAHLTVSGTGSTKKSGRKK